MDKISKWILAFLLCSICLISCGPERDFFLKEEKMQAGYEYVSDIVVTKKGFRLFWIIPLRFGSVDAAKDLMIEETLSTFPDAVGMFEVKVIEESGISFFDWVPETRMTGKIVTKKKDKE